MKDPEYGVDSRYSSEEERKKDGKKLMKARIIRSIEQRIKDEHRKQSLDWERIAAQKIYSTWFPLSIIENNILSRIFLICVSGSIFIILINIILKW